MPKYKIFKDDDFTGKQGAQLQQAAQQIKQKFDQKRNRYHQLRNQLDIGYDWDELNEKIINFDNTKFIPWNQKWATLSRSNNLQQLTDFFNEGMRFFEEMDEYINSLVEIKNNTFDLEAFKEEIVSSVLASQSNSANIDALKTEVITKIQDDILHLKADIAVQVERGINDLIGLKEELGLEKNFQENIETELDKSKIYRNGFLFLFISSVMAIPMFLLSTFLYEPFKALQYNEVIFLRIGITMSSAILSYFLYTQYKLYQVISLRYSHLHGFLGGGATFINQLIDSEDNVKMEINRKMAELFMDLEVVFGEVEKQQHPIEMTLDKAVEVADKVGNIASKIQKG